MTVAGPVPDAELAFVAACCRRPALSADRLLDAAAEVDDWPLVATMAERHRVVGFVVVAIRDLDAVVPSEVRDRLAGHARTNAAQNLRNLGEEIRVDTALRDRGLEPLFLKGTAMGLRLYASLSIKTSWDIDVLMSPDEVSAASDVLQSLGYRPQMPEGMGADQFERFSAIEKEVVWSHPDRGTSVELHRQLTYYPGMVPDLARAAPRQTLATGEGRGIATFADADLVAYLGVHGMLHGWARLKWLVDFNALIDASGIDARTLDDHARAVGAGRSVAAGLLLCHRLLGLMLEPAHEAAMIADPAVRRLVAASLDLIDERGTRDGAEFDRPANTVRLLWLNLLILPGWTGAFGVALAILSRRRWPFQFRLPAALVGVSTVVVAFPRLLYRVTRFRHVRAKVAGG